MRVGPLCLLTLNTGAPASAALVDALSICKGLTVQKPDERNARSARLAAKGRTLQLRTNS